jgi:heat shock protein HslJ
MRTKANHKAKQVLSNREEKKMLIQRLSIHRNLPHFRALLPVLLMGFILLSACSSPTPSPVTSAQPTAAPTQMSREVDVDRLHNTIWLLVAYGDPDTPTVIEQGIRITAEFDPEGQVSGFAGCNYYSGTFEASSDGSLSFGPQVTSSMECSRGMELEAAYLATMQNPESFDFSDQGRLQISYLSPAGETQQLVYTVGQASLTENVWVLMSFGNPAAPEMAPPGSVLTVNFSEDGWMSGFSGCNRFNTSFTAEDGTLTLGPVASTMMECLSDMEQEKIYQGAISSVETYEISGPNLTLTYNNGAGVLNFTSATLPLEHTLWTLVAIDGNPLADKTQITAMFEPGEEVGTGTIGGSSGCNNYNAGYTIDGYNIEVQTALTTLMMCPEDMDVEESFLQALQAAQTFEIFADRLVLRTDYGNFIFAANRTPLTGALWTLIAIGDPDSPQPLVQGSNFTAQFMSVPNAPSGWLVGSTGCNEYSTAYAASLDEIRVNPPSRTANTSCVPGLIDQEELFFLALTDAENYRISGNSLIIPYDEGRQTMIFVGTQTEVSQRLPLTDLNDTNWYLWFLNNQPVANGTTISAHFTVNPDSSSGTINGEAGCNRYAATFGEQLGMQTTLNARETCLAPTGVMEQESGYLGVLQRTYGYWASANQLILNSGQGILTYRRTQPPESSDQTHLLIGMRWYLVSHNNTYSTPGDQEPFVRFTEEGTMTGFTGCNTIGANFETNISQISFSNINASGQSCRDRALETQQAAILDVLGSARSYQLVDTAMQIVGDKGVLNFSLTPINRPEVQPPQVVINAPERAKLGEVVTFDASGTSSQLPITNWRWDFGDGNRGTGPVVQHVYRQPGNYITRLVAVDKGNNRGNRSHTIAIVQSEQPTPEPTQVPPNPEPTPPPGETPTPEPTKTPEPETKPPQAAVLGPTSGYVGEPLVFDASGTQVGSNPISSFTWNFGDGTSTGASTEAMQSTIYNRPGVYQVSVLVADQGGLSSSATLEVTITTRLDTPHVWVLDELKTDPLLRGTAITLQFLDGKVAGFAGCNSYSGNYTYGLNQDGTYSVRIERITTSKLACPQEIAEQEDDYLEALEEVTIATIFMNYMDLIYPEGVLKYIVIDTSR